jgi:hypothetical protein
MLQKKDILSFFATIPDKDLEDQRGSAICPGLPSWPVGELGCIFPHSLPLWTEEVKKSLLDMFGEQTGASSGAEAGAVS